MAYKRKRQSGLMRFLNPKVLAGTLAVAVLVVVGLEATNTTHIFHNSNKSGGATFIPTTSQPSPGSSQPQKATTPSTSNSSAGANGTMGSSKDTNTSSSSAPNSGAAPVKPYGDFISNHSPGSNGTPYDEVSVCYTTPGASCAITFTNANGTMHALSAKTTGSDGSTTWNWSANTLGPGHWDVTVTASLNGKTASATDSMDVGP